jgi:hypothetical protein
LGERRGQVVEVVAEGHVRLAFCCSVHRCNEKQ